MDTTGKRFCAWCGAVLERRYGAGAFRLICTRCGKITFENPITGVAGIILSQDKRILLGRRGRGETMAGAFCIPCGHVEYDEDIRQALVREMREETGFLVTPERVYEVYSNFHEPAAHTTGTWFLCQVRGGTARAGDDVAEVGFFSYETLPPLAFSTDRLVLERLHREGLLR